MRLLKSAFSLVLGAGAVSILAETVPQLAQNAGVVYLIFLFAAWLTVYCATKHKKLNYFSESLETVKEYIVLSSGELGRKEFRLQDHPSFTELLREGDTVTYTDASGVLLITKLVTVRRANDGSANPYLLLVSCAVVALAGLFGCELFRLWTRPGGPPRFLLTRAVLNGRGVLPTLERLSERLKDLRLPQRTGDLRRLLYALKNAIDGTRLDLCVTRLRGSLTFGEAWSILRGNLGRAVQWAEKLEEMVVTCLS